MPSFKKHDRGPRLRNQLKLKRKSKRKSKRKVPAYLPVSFLCSRLIPWLRRNRLQRRLEETIGEDVVTGTREIVKTTTGPSVVAISAPVAVTRTIIRAVSRLIISAVTRTIVRAIVRAVTRTEARTETRTAINLVTRGTAPGLVKPMIREIETLTTVEDPIVEMVMSKIGLIDLEIKRNSQEIRNRINSSLEKRVTIKGIRVIASVVNKNAVVSLLNQRTLNSVIGKNSHRNQRQPKQHRLRILNHLPGPKQRNPW